MATSLAEAGPEANRPWAASASPPRPQRAVITAERRRLRFDGAGGAPDIAATGGTRVARRPGTRAATRVTPMPTTREITIVRVSITRPLLGIPKPTASK